MKQTVRTSRTAGQLEKMFRAINTHFYNNELPEPIITLKKTPNAYGHITCSKTWQAGSERRYEINISTATLDRPILLEQFLLVIIKVVFDIRAIRSINPNQEVV